MSANRSWAPTFYHSSEEVEQLVSAVSELAGFSLSRAQDADNSTLAVLETVDHTVDHLPRAVLSFGVHPRELISTEISFWLIKLLSGDTAVLEAWPEFQKQMAKLEKLHQSRQCHSFPSCIEDLLQQVSVVILPSVNSKARLELENGAQCTRKTMHGVDLNRNWATGWQPNRVSGEDYSGPTPFSDGLTRLIRDVIAVRLTSTFIDVHSGEWAIYIPWDSKKGEPSDLPDDTDTLLKSMNTFCECQTGPGGEVASYLAPGSAMDYVYSELHVPYVLTLETFGRGGEGKLASGGRKLLAPDCFHLFNPATETAYQSVVSSWLAALITALIHTASSPTSIAHSNQLPSSVTSANTSTTNQSLGAVTSSQAVNRPPLTVPSSDDRTLHSRLPYNKPVMHANRFGHFVGAPIGKRRSTPACMSHPTHCMIFLSVVVLVLIACLVRRLTVRKQRVREARP